MITKISVAIKNFLIARFSDESAFDDLCRESQIRYVSPENFEARITGFLKKASASYPDYIVKIYNACITLRPQYRSEINRLFEVTSTQTGKDSELPSTQAGGDTTAKFTLRILHISDLHFRTADTDPVRSFNADPAALSMIKKIEELPAFDMIIITGDLVFNGKENEFDVAEVFCRKLLDVINLPNNRLFVVPGNHDVDRSVIKNWHINDIYSFMDQDTITEKISDTDLLPILLKKFSAFSAFANTISGRTLFDENRFFYVRQIPVRKQGQTFTINLLGLNSALFAGYDGDDRKKLALGRYQAENAVRRIDENGLITIICFHHPFSCFHKEDKSAENLLIQHGDMILHGHLHEPENAAAQIAAGETVVIGTGTGFEKQAGKRTGENTFAVIDLDIMEGEGSAGFYTYVSNQNRWVFNNTINPHTEDGMFRFTLTRLKDAGGKITPIPLKKKELTEDLSPYLAWLSDNCGFIDIRGIMTRGGKAQRFPIKTLYIPLATQSRKTDFSKAFDKSFDHEPEKQVPLSSVLTDRLIVITGDPGSGKTTFLKLIASTLGRAYSLDDVNIIRKELGMENLIFPLFIRVGELTAHMTHCRKQNRECPDYHDLAWLIHFLNTQNDSLNWRFSGAFFREKLTAGGCLVLLDGLDEAPGQKIREEVSTIVLKAVTAYRECRFVVTSRPRAYTGMVQMPDFIPYTIAALDDKGIEHFLTLWTNTLFSKALLRATKEKHLAELLRAVRQTPAIRRMALNPLMLTALAVIHWHEKRLPEQRAELFESIIKWLLRSREYKPGRLPVEKREICYQTMAFNMHTSPEGRQVTIGNRTACEILAGDFPGKTKTEKIRNAGCFLAGEELESGIIVKRGTEIQFAHLTFQEYLTAKFLGGMADTEQQNLLLKESVLPDQNWKEPLLLFCGVLYKQGPNKIDGFLDALLAWQKKKCKTLQEKAPIFGLMGAIERDLSPYNYAITNPDFTVLKNEVMAIFDLEKARTIPLDVRSEAADALGRAGDPRLSGDTFVTIPGCTFLMGAQSVDENEPNYDPDAGDAEAPVHEVKLTGYRIGKYPVTVGEYARFIEDNGYGKKEYWKAGGYKQFSEPADWENQKQFPSRPVTGVSWFEASAFAAWAGCTLPTEAQWERAARGAGEYRKYSWGNDDPGKETTNWIETGLGHPSVVGLFPANMTKEGIYDMSGKIWEWCSDWYGEYTGKSETDPEGPKKGGYRVLRGGSWRRFAGSTRSACRLWYGPSNRYVSAGLRLARGHKGEA